MDKSQGKLLLGLGAGALLAWLLFRKQSVQGSANVHFNSTYQQFSDTNARAVWYTVTNQDGSVVVPETYDASDAAVDGAFTVAMRPELMNIYPV